MVSKRAMKVDGGDFINVTQETWDDEPSAKPPIMFMIEDKDPLKARIDRIPVEYLLMSEMGLEEMIRETRDGAFDKTLGIVKLMFWDEYHTALSLKRKMVSKNVWEPVVSPTWWLHNVMRNHLHLAWIIHPPARDAILQREMINVGMRRLRQVLELPFVSVEEVKKVVEGQEVLTKVEKVNVSLIREMHSIVKTMQNRVDPIVAKVRVQSENLHYVKNEQIAVGPQQRVLPPTPYRQSIEEARHGLQENPDQYMPARTEFSDEESLPYVLPKEEPQIVVPSMDDVDPVNMTMEELDALDGELSDIKDKVSGVVVEDEVEEGSSVELTEEVSGDDGSK